MLDSNNQVLEKKCTESEHGQPFLTSSKDTIEVPFDAKVSVSNIRITFPNNHGQIAELLIYKDLCATHKMDCPKLFRVSGYSKLDGSYSITCKTSKKKPVWYSSKTKHYFYQYNADAHSNWVFAQKVNSGNDDILAWTPSTSSSSCADFVEKGSWRIWNINDWLPFSSMVVINSNSCPKSYQVSGHYQLNGLYSKTSDTSRNKPVWYSSNTKYYLYLRYSKSMQRADWVFAKHVNSPVNDELFAWTDSIVSSKNSSCANFVEKGSWKVWKNGWFPNPNVALVPNY